MKGQNLNYIRNCWMFTLDFPTIMFASKSMISDVLYLSQNSIYLIQITSSKPTTWSK